jgi:hypothetical protein
MPLCVKGRGSVIGRRLVARPGSGLAEEPVAGGVIRPRWLQIRSPIALRGP